VQEFDIDGLRLDAADVLDFGFMHEIRELAYGLKDDFWLLGEVIHGEYSRWVNNDMLNSVTDYALHKALYSGHNDHNYFEIAHTFKRQRDMGLGDAHLYHFVDNHDVERITTKLRDKRHYLPVHILLYALPGIPSVYYGSEFGIDGRKEQGSDASLRPALAIEELSYDNEYYQIIKKLNDIHNKEADLWYGYYSELELTTTKYAFSRGDVLITVTNGESEEFFDIMASGSYVGALSGRKLTAEQGRLRFAMEGCSGEIWIPSARNRHYE